MAGDFDSYVDRVLEKLKDGRPRHIFGVLDESVPELNQKDERTIFIDYLKEKGLIVSINETQAKITPHGYDVYHLDGWAKHLIHEKEKRRLELELINSSIRTNKSSQDNNRLQKILLWATAIFTFITLCITTADYIVHRKELEVAEETLHKQEVEVQGLQKNQKTEFARQDSSKIKNDTLSNH